MDCWAVWSTLPAEERRQAVALSDAPIVCHLSAQMQALWQAEIQLRAFGLAGNIHPFDHSQLPLLSAMEFNDPMQEGDQSLHMISWPAAFHEDPTSVEVAVKQALGTTRPRRTLQPRHWKQLLHPGPQTWLDLEQSLAKLVEQTVLHAVSAWSASRATATGEDEVAELGLVAGTVLTSRAAKRLRQRERRKLCRKGVISAVGASDAAADIGGEMPVATLEAPPRPLSERCGSKAQHDDGASELSVSTATGSHSQSAGEATSGRECPDSPRAADSLSEASGRSGRLANDPDEEPTHGGRRCEGRFQAAEGARHRKKAPSRPWWDVSDEEDAEDEDALSTQRPSSGSGDDGRTPCSAGSYGLLSMDEFSLKVDFEEPADSGRFERQASSASELSDFEDAAPSGQVTGCPTPNHLWPSTPEHSPRRGPTDAAGCPPPLFSLPSLAPGVWQLA